MIKIISVMTLFLTCVISTPALATLQDGLGFELGVGYSQFGLSTPTQNAKYSGVTTQGNFLLPILSSGQFSIDLDFLYRYTSLENNSSSSIASEWSHQTSFGSGLRFNYSYLFAGIDYLFSKGEHVQSGTVNRIFEYNYNPIQWHAGLSLPLSPVTSIVVGYSQMLESEFEVQGESFSSNEEIFWLKLQIDFGVSFLNLLSPSESFEPTRSEFFVN